MRNLFPSFLFRFIFLIVTLSGVEGSFGQSQLDSIERSLKNIHDDTNKVNSLNALSRNYHNAPNYEKEILTGKQAQELAEKLHYQKGIANALNNIGNAYYGLEEFDRALEYHMKSLKIRLELGNKKDISASYNNIGNAYEGKLDYGLALEYKIKALKLREQLADKELIARSCNNIANIYSSLHNFNIALKYISRSQKIYNEINDIDGITISFITASNIYKDSGNYALSNEYAKKALALADSLGDISQALNAHGILYQNYSRAKDATKALFHHEKYIELRDSIYSIERAKQLAEEESKIEYEKREQQLKFEQEKKNVLAAAEQKRQRTIIYSIIGGLILVIIFAGFIFRSLRTTQRQKKIIEVQKIEVEKQRELADSRRIIAEDQRAIIEKQKTEVEESKKIIEQHNKDITDSINYAQRIQKALLASDNLLNKNLAEHFVLFKPKDIVSGDFYWATEKDNRFYLAVCDSTGHGVPGAFMSLLNISFLNEAITEKNIIQPNEVFNHVRQRLIENISSVGAQDGMDGILICIDKNKNEITYAAANNAPILMDGTLQQLETDNMPVGFADKLNSFKHETLNIKHGNTLYLYTDGFADQFGGPKGKKFKYKPLNEKISEISVRPMNEQRENLENIFENWKGALEQVDDVLIIAIRV